MTGRNDVYFKILTQQVKVSMFVVWVETVCVCNTGKNNVYFKILTQQVKVSVVELRAYWV